MKKRKSTSVYRKLLSESLSLAWSRKHLWIFGIFAGIMMSGGAVDMALSSLRRADKTATWLELFNEPSFFGFRVFSSYVQQNQALGIKSVMWIVTIIALVLIGVLAASVISQAALILGSKSKHPVHNHALRKRALSHFAPILLIDLLAKISTTIFVGITALPFFALGLRASLTSLSITITQTVLMLILIIVINILSMLSIIHIVEKNSSALEGLYTAWNIFSRHWLSTFEFGVLLFLISLFGAGIIFGIGALILIPYSIAYTFSLLSGSMLFFLLINVLFSMIIAGLLLAFMGAIVAFQYIAWHRLYARAVSRAYGKKHIAKILRLFGVRAFEH